MEPRSTIAVIGSPTALGGHFGGMERTPAELRRAGLLEAIATRPGLAEIDWQDRGDAPNQPGWAADPDPRAKNRALLRDYLPRLAGHVADATTIAAAGGSTAARRLVVLGGDCTTHPAAMAGLRRSRPGLRLGLAWFDAHGDFNTPDTTPSGNVWGMPFAMACGRGDDDLVAAVVGPSVREADAALLGGQVLDETESRMLAASGVAQFGPGMLADPAGLAALLAWAGVVGDRIDGWYIAFDLDALDGADGYSLAMPEPDGLALATAIGAIRAIAAGGPVLGFGATAAMARPDVDLGATVTAIADLTEAAFA
jgi:arginase